MTPFSGYPHRNPSVLDKVWSGKFGSGLVKTSLSERFPPRQCLQQQEPSPKINHKRELDWKAWSSKSPKTPPCWQFMLDIPPDCRSDLFPASMVQRLEEALNVRQGIILRRGQELLPEGWADHSTTQPTPLHTSLSGCSQKGCLGWTHQHNDGKAWQTVFHAIALNSRISQAFLLLTFCHKQSN